MVKANVFEKLEKKVRNFADNKLGFVGGIGDLITETFNNARFDDRLDKAIALDGIGMLLDGGWGKAYAIAQPFLINKMYGEDLTFMQKLILYPLAVYEEFRGDNYEGNEHLDRIPSFTAAHTLAAYNRAREYVEVNPVDLIPEIDTGITPDLAYATV